MLTRVHHINVLVRDLDASVAQYRKAFGLPEPLLETLAGRGARTARFRIGETWLVLVQPVDPDGVPGRHLAEHGEGLFLLSLGVDDLDAARQSLLASGTTLQGTERSGLANWRVQDLPMDEFGGAQLQLCQDPAATR